MDFRAAIVVGLACLTSWQCGRNELGHVMALETGDLRWAPAPRGAFDQEYQEACGDLGVTDAGSGFFAVTPYLQRMTARGASLHWSSLGGGASVLIRAEQGGLERDVSRDAVLAPRSPMVGTAYSVELPALFESALACYEIFDDGGGLVFRGGFRTPPATGTGTIAFAALGDVGSASRDQLSVRDELETVALDLLVVTGDVGYEKGRRAELERNFLGIYRDLLSVAPVFPAAGNHDYGSGDVDGFRDVFDLPLVDPQGGIWYGFDWGPVHFSVLDTERNLEAQRRWLETDLARAGDAWKIVLLHKPPYSSGQHGSDLAVREAFGEVLTAGGAHLVLAGHEHNYERTESIDGVVYVITGGGGRGTRSVGESAFTAFSQRVAHFVYVTADSETLFLYAIDALGNDFDSLRLTRFNQD